MALTFYKGHSVGTTDGKWNFSANGGYIMVKQNGQWENYCFLTFFLSNTRPLKHSVVACNM